jgi:hypothetical protein
MDAHDSLPQRGPGASRSVEGIAKTAARMVLGPLMDAHPAAEFFPMLGETEFETFKADIAANGLHEAIWICDGKILDGRNRYRACVELGITPLFRTYTGPSPVSFAWSQNGERRHLNHGQRSAIGVEMLPALQDEARKRQLAGLKRGSNPPVPPKVGERETGKAEAVDEAGRIVGTSGSSVQRAKAVKAADPEAFEKIKQGVLRIGPAYNEMRRKAGGPKSQPREVRQEDIRRLAKEGNRSEQIADALHISGEQVRKLARLGGIPLPDLTIGHAAKISARRVVVESVSTLEGVALGLKTITGARLQCSREEAIEWVKSIDASVRIVGKLRRLLRGFYEQQA